MYSFGSPLPPRAPGGVFYEEPRGFLSGLRRLWRRLNASQGLDPDDDLFDSYSGMAWCFALPRSPQACCQAGPDQARGSASPRLRLLPPATPRRQRASLPSNDSERQVARCRSEEQDGPARGGAAAQCGRGTLASPGAAGAWLRQAVGAILPGAIGPSAAHGACKLRHAEPMARRGARSGRGRRRRAPAARLCKARACSGRDAIHPRARCERSRVRGGDGEVATPWEGACE